MKKTILIIIASSAVLTMNAQGEFGFAFQYVKPRGGMSETINNGFGFTLEAAHNFDRPFSAGLEFSYNNYGYSRTKQQYTFDDGSVTDTYVNVDNYFLNLNTTGRWFLRNGKTINPYLSAKLGYSWYRTSLNIEDPEDETACEPLESHILSKDGTVISSGGAGVRIDLGTFLNSVEPGKLFIDMNAHLVQGGRVKYMNADHDPDDHPDSDVTAQFINRQTQVVHEHHVGYVYSSFANMMEYRFSIILRPH